MDNEVVYPLAHKWAFYMSHITSGKSKKRNKIAFVDFSKKLLKLAKFDTLNDFVKLINYMPSTAELKNGTYYVFKDEIQPAWEDEKNKGGEITEVFYCNKKITLTDNVRQNFDEVWHAILFSVVGGSFSMIDDRINGVVCKIRDDFLKVEFWLSKKSNDADPWQKMNKRLRSQESPEPDLMTVLDTVIPFPLFDISTSPIPSSDNNKDESNNQGLSAFTGSGVGGNTFEKAVAEGKGAVYGGGFKDRNSAAGGRKDLRK